MGETRQARIQPARGREAAKDTREDLDQEKRTGEEEAEVEARGKSHGGPKAVQSAKRSPRDPEAGQGVREEHRDQEVAARGDQEGQEADLAVDPADQEVDQKADLRRNLSED